MKLKLTVIISGLLALIATMALTSTFPLAFARAQEGIVAVVSKIMLENRTLNMIVVFLLAVIMG